MLKLLMNNISGKVYRAIKCMYSGIISSILLGEHMTDSFSCNAGVRQGDVLSTTLFNIYVNDLVNEIRNLNMVYDLEMICVYLYLYMLTILFC